MNYQEARQFLASAMKYGIKLDLERMQQLMHVLHNPQKNAPFYTYCRDKRERDNNRLLRLDSGSGQSSGGTLHIPLSGSLYGTHPCY